LRGVDKKQSWTNKKRSDREGKNWKKLSFLWMNNTDNNNNIDRFIYR